MKKEIYQKRTLMAIAAIALTAALLIYPIKAFAIESIAIPLQMVGDDVISMDIPVVSESDTSVFDFILDPQGLLYETDAARYGGGIVEEGATLLFFNSEGEYDFSKCSDFLTVTNRSTVPVQVTITAQIMDFGDVKIVESDNFTESEELSIYLAIVDDQGNVQPLSADGQASISLEMDAGPENAYVFRLDEETNTYQYGLSMDPDAIDFDSYSFGLMGACNSNAVWRDVSIRPMIEVTWRVEPIIPEQEEVSLEDNNTNNKLESDNVLGDDPSKDNKGNTGNGLDDDNDDNVPVMDPSVEGDENDLNDVPENNGIQGEGVEDEILQDAEGNKDLQDAELEDTDTQESIDSKEE